jgi:hypothetical protein
MPTAARSRTDSVRRAAARAGDRHELDWESPAVGWPAGGPTDWPGRRRHLGPASSPEGRAEGSRSPRAVERIVLDDRADVDRVASRGGCASSSGDASAESEERRSALDSGSVYRERSGAARDLRGPRVERSISPRRKRSTPESISPSGGNSMSTPSRCGLPPQWRGLARSDKWSEVQAERRKGPVPAGARSKRFSPTRSMSVCGTMRRPSRARTWRNEA